MAELTRKQAKESGMLGDYAHMFDIDTLKTQIPNPQETQPPNAVLFAAFNHVTTRTDPTYIIEASLFDDYPYDGSYKLAEFQGFIIYSNTLEDSLSFGKNYQSKSNLGTFAERRIRFEHRYALHHRRRCRNRCGQIMHRQLFRIQPSERARYVDPERLRQIDFGSQQALLHPWKGDIQPLSRQML